MLSIHIHNCKLFFKVCDYLLLAACPEIACWKWYSQKISGYTIVKYSRMDQVRPYLLKFFKGCLPQILLGPFLNTLSQIYYSYSNKDYLKHSLWIQSRPNQSWTKYTNIKTLFFFQDFQIMKIESYWIKTVLMSSKFWLDALFMLQQDLLKYQIWICQSQKHCKSKYQNCLSKHQDKYLFTLQWFHWDPS